MEETRKGRFRLSLRRFFVLLTLIVLGASHLRTSYQLHLANLELARVDWETGELEILDRNTINVVAAPTNDDETMRWRVYFPPGREYVLNSKFNALPQAGLPPAPTHSETLFHGEWLVELRFERNRGEGWNILQYVRRETPLGLVTGTSSSQKLDTIDEASSAWLTHRWPNTIEQAGAGGTELFNAGDGVTLLRLRVSVGGTSGADQSGAYGMMLWISPQ